MCDVPQPQYSEFHAIFMLSLMALNIEKRVSTAEQSLVCAITDLSHT